MRIIGQLNFRRYMAQKDSPLKRRMRRLKRENTLLHRVARANAQQFAQSRMFLLGVLAQNGGEVRVTAGTLKQVVANPNLSVEASRNAEDTELTIRLVDGAPIATPVTNAYTQAAINKWDAMTPEERAIAIANPVAPTPYEETGINVSDNALTDFSQPSIESTEV
jgi:hypothetical protein